MMPDVAELYQAELNDLLEAYERARAAEGDVDLRDCVPRRNHPIYLEARRELVRLDLEYRWQQGQPKHLIHYAELFPDLFDDPQSAQDIAFEEYRQRVLAGENPSALEYARCYGIDTASWPGSDAEFANYPKTIVAEEVPEETTGSELNTVVNRMKTPPLDWDMLEDREGEPSFSLSGEMAKALLDQKVPHSNAEVSFLLAQALHALPGIGAQFLNFQLIAELGRGSFGRVYLARQGGLANRLVALKLTVDLQGEEQKLAQLQHTNVVPVYSAHKTKTLHAVCMPYFGPTTIADVLRLSRQFPSLPATGAFLVEALRQRMDEFLAQTGARASVPTAGSAAPGVWKMLEKASYVNAVLWLAERVTEGLMHAHEHGILHGDLKPANILLTEEGRPMLLDFNLATDIKVRAAIGELRVGGTLPYMAPEHLRALQGGDRRSVDARSDVYALGVILFEMLTGKAPFESRRGPLAETLPGMIDERMQAPPRLRQHNPAVTPAMESIVRHCLQPDPTRRYQTAQELHEDLQRQANDLPLAHAPEPSLRERAGKWMRRHPHLSAPQNVIVVCLVLLALMIAPGAWRAWENWQTDREQLAKAQDEANKAKQNTEDVQKKLLSADERIRGAETRAAALDRFRSFHAEAGAARELVDRVTLARMRPEAAPVETENIRKNAAASREILRAYNVLTDADWQSNSLVAALPERQRNQLHADVASLLYALVDAELLPVQPLRGSKGEVRAVDGVEAIGVASQLGLAVAKSRVAVAAKWNALACDCFADDQPPRALLMQQAEIALLAGKGSEAHKLWARADAAKLRDDVEDAYWTAAILAALGKTKGADELLNDVTRQTPDHFGAWRLRALCHQSAGEFRQAESCWDTCAALKPDDEWTRFCRGQTSLHQRKWTDAQKDFDAFLTKHPDFRVAYLHRAAALEGQHNYQGAIDDLTRAIELGPTAPELLFQRVELMEKNKDKKGAELDRIRLLSTEPARISDWIYRGMIQERDNPKAALADLERALAEDPNNVVALYHKALMLADRFNRPNEAIGALNRLLIADPKHADARLKRGLLYAKLDIRDKAVADADRALERDKTPARCYLAACIFAHTSRDVPADKSRVIELLEFALRNGYANDQVRTDPNLPVAHIPEAADLIRAAPYLAPIQPKQ